MESDYNFWLNIRTKKPGEKKFEVVGSSFIKVFLTQAGIPFKEAISLEEKKVILVSDPNKWNCPRVTPERNFNNDWTRIVFCCTKVAFENLTPIISVTEATMKFDFAFYLLQKYFGKNFIFVKCGEFQVPPIIALPN